MKAKIIAGTFETHAFELGSIVEIKSEKMVCFGQSVGVFILKTRLSSN